MGRFYEVFKTIPAVLPVIHVVNEKQAVENATIAWEQGSDGVFLINHDVSGNELLEIYESVANELPDLWIGINCLDLKPDEVIGKVSQRSLFNLSGIWADNAMINEHSEDQPEAEMIDKFRQKSGWKGLYFGGVAFKYQRRVYEIEKAAQIAAKYIDIVTTSGPATGQAAEIEKIRRMKAAIGDKPLAIASGITPENVHNYLGISDCFLVATGISKDFTNIDPKRLKTLIENVRKGGD
ncbi:MAG: BtpA/SgcQ family protein [bacterium]|nr:BtpA/SgcQ family protein [bacterium]